MESFSSIPDIIPRIPGYTFFSQLILQRFGIDISQCASAYLVVYALFQASQYVYYWLSEFILSHFTSYVEVDDWDLLYTHMMDWASAHRMTTLSRELKAVTFDSTTTPESNSARDRLDEREGDSSNVNGLFNFHAWYRKNPLIYKPNFNAKYFTHRGYLFYWCSNQRPSIAGGNLDRFIVIRCFGRSTKPIKDLLHEIKGFSLTNEHKTTEVYRSSLQSEGQWLRQSIKPSRPVCTVSLDEQQKAQVILDLNEYLQPLTARWYATRGIPYRRGYLFHGPPGTGKTSLSFALAGVFGLSIYCVSLSETGLTESHLASLFSNLPKRCVILLEDIDAAGLRRDNDLSDELGSYELPGSKSRRSSISLAGLLNIIDGAASHEGRVLIMTTNRRETLDSALIRPGRVDHQIRFTLATREQIRDLYKRMYSADQGTDKTKTEATAINSMHEVLASCGTVTFNLRPHIRRCTIIEPEKLTDLADLFADRLPDNVFSPAAIQGYLLKRRSDPEGALKEIATWRDEEIHSMMKTKSLLPNCSPDLDGDAL